MAKRITNLSAQKLVSSMLKWGTQIFFVFSICILGYMSFVTSFDISPKLKTLSTMGIIGVALNFWVWESYHNLYNNKVLTADLLNEKYSIHRRYYNARKGWKQVDLQKTIRRYNIDFVNAWKEDIIDITARTIEDIEKGPYKGNSHKWLIFRVKHHIYPKSGIKRAREVLSVLDVGKSSSMKINLKQAEISHKLGGMSKLITSVLGLTLAGSITTSFIDGDLKSAIFVLMINIVLLFSSLLFGAMKGTKDAKIQLSIAEQVSSLLEEWKNAPPSEEPYSVMINDAVENKIVSDNSSNVTQPSGVIEII